jgi:hypothetical protein
MKSIKTFFFAITVILLSLLIESCNPNSTNLNPDPLNEFEINLIDTNPSLQTFTDISTVIIDNDTLEFDLKSGISGTFQANSVLAIRTNSSNFESLTVLQYPQDRFLNTTDSNGVPSISGVVNSGKFIDSTIEFWVPFLTNTVSGRKFYGVFPLYLNSDASPAIYYGAIFGQNQYVVFRKLKGINYQYYWVRIICQYGVFFPEKISVLNGKYQLNSITTGL